MTKMLKWDVELTFAAGTMPDHAQVVEVVAESMMIVNGGSLMFVVAGKPKIVYGPTAWFLVQPKVGA